MPSRDDGFLTKTDLNTLGFFFWDYLFNDINQKSDAGVSFILAAHHGAASFSFITKLSAHFKLSAAIFQISRPAPISAKKHRKLLHLPHFHDSLGFFYQHFLQTIFDFRRVSIAFLDPLKKSLFASFRTNFHEKNKKMYSHFILKKIDRYWKCLKISNIKRKEAVNWQYNVYSNRSMVAGRAWMIFFLFYCHI